jgi:hypothetical protein
MSEEKKLMAKIEQLEGEERIRALEKAIGLYEGEDEALPFIEKAIEYYKGTPEAIPFVDQAIKRRKESVKSTLTLSPILVVGGWVWSNWLMSFMWNIFPPTIGRYLLLYVIFDGIGMLAVSIGILFFGIGFPYYTYKFLGLKRLRRRLARLAG